MQKIQENAMLISKNNSIITKPIVYLQSAVVVGTFFWVPALIYYIIKKYKTTKQKAISLLSIIFIILLPIKKSSWVQKLFVWDHYNRYFKTQVVGIPFSRKQTVFGIIPHGKR
jgi:hypothetical protein